MLADLKDASRRGRLNLGNRAYRASLPASGTQLGVGSAETSALPRLAGEGRWMVLPHAYRGGAINAFSIADVTIRASGAVSGDHRPRNSPSRPMRNFAKFHPTFPGRGGCDVSHAYRGCIPGSTQRTLPYIR
jgi:hypothetical protein